MPVVYRQGSAGTLTPLAEATGPAPPGTGLLVGAANTPDYASGDGRTPKQAWDDLDAAVGPLGVRRSYERALPATFASSTAGFDVGEGRASILSFKYPPGEVAAGAHDAAVTAFVQSIPAGHLAFLVYYHEPEDNMTAAEYVAAAQHVHDLVTAVGNLDVRAGTILMAWTWNPLSGRDPDAWWPGDTHADFLGVDVYNPYTPASLPPNDPSKTDSHWKSPSTLLADVETWAAAHQGVPLMVTETGCHEDDTGVGPVRKANWLTAMVQHCDQAGYRAVCYFDSYIGPQGPWWLRTSPQATSAYQAAAAAHPAGA